MRLSNDDIQQIISELSNNEEPQSRVMNDAVIVLLHELYERRIAEETDFNGEIGSNQ